MVAGKSSWNGKQSRSIPSQRSRACGVTDLMSFSPEITRVMFSTQVLDAALGIFLHGERLPSAPEAEVYKKSVWKAGADPITGLPIPSSRPCCIYLWLLGYVAYSLPTFGLPTGSLLPFFLVPIPHATFLLTLSFLFRLLGACLSGNCSERSGKAFSIQDLQCLRQRVRPSRWLSCLGSGN